MELRGRCTQIENRDPLTGAVTFLFLDFDLEQEIRAIGVAARIERNLQYLIDGDYNADGTFRFGKIRPFSCCSKESIDLLVDHVSGISEPIAREIVGRFGDDIFAYQQITGLEKELVNIHGIGPKRAQAIMSFIKQGSEENYLFQFLSANEIPYVSVLAVLNEKPTITIDDIKTHPYRLMNYEVPFEICDRIAITNHVDPWSFERIHSMAKQIIRRIHNRGSTRMPFEAFLKELTMYSLHNGKSTIGIPKDLAEIIIGSASYLVTYFDDGIEYIETKDFYFKETQIAKQVIRLQNSRRGFTEDVSPYIEIAEKDGKAYNQEQREVFKVLETGGISVLTGGPGTGKTTAINGLIKAFFEMKPDGSVLLCAPTGRAAARMTEISGHAAKTLHKAMSLQWYNHDVKVDPLKYEFIIVDEMSMCDTELFFYFLRATQSGTAILLAGDYDQIPSVGPGQVLRDIIESRRFPIYRLVQTIRQEEGSLIIRNGKAVLHGEELTSGEDFQIVTLPNDQAIYQVIQKLKTESMPQILCPIKKSLVGTNSINRLVQSIYHWDTDSLWLDGTRFYVGDQIIMNSNNYEVGYMNGDVGSISSLHDGWVEINFADRSLLISIGQLDDMKLSYALTFHKSQGAECEHVLIVLPSNAKTMASRELLYTAVTRAKKKVWLLAIDEVLDAFLKADKNSKRDCGLKSALTGTIS